MTSGRSSLEGEASCHCLASPQSQGKFLWFQKFDNVCNGIEVLLLGNKQGLTGINVLWAVRVHQKTLPLLGSNPSTYASHPCHSTEAGLHHCKFWIAPLNRLTLPRLELVACFLGA